MKKWVGIILITLSLGVCLLSLRDAPRGGKEAYAASGRSGAFLSPGMLEGTVRVNEAELEELIMLPGIGETIGQAILEEREAHGAFHYPEDLLSVRGIGPAKLEGIRAFLDLTH